METNLKVNDETVKIKISPYNARNSIGCYKKKIYNAFEKIGIKDQYIEVSFGGAGGWKTPSWAKVEWYVNGESFSYKCDTQQRDVDNLAAIAQIIETDSKAIRRGLKSFGMVMSQFKIGYNPDAPAPKTPREILGIEESIKDPEFITFKYKQLARKYHPDNKETGDEDEFREINEAYKQIQEELQ